MAEPPSRPTVGLSTRHRAPSPIREDGGHHNESYLPDRGSLEPCCARLYRAWLGPLYRRTLPRSIWRHAYDLNANRYRPSTFFIGHLPPQCLHRDRDGRDDTIPQCAHYPCCRPIGNRNSQRRPTRFGQSGTYHCTPYQQLSYWTTYCDRSPLLLLGSAYGHCIPAEPSTQTDDGLFQRGQRHNRGRHHRSVFHSLTGL